MLPVEILDRVTALNLQHGEVISIINQLSRPSEITSQLVLDELSAKIKGAFAEADRAIDHLESTVEMEENPRTRVEAEVYLAKVVEDFNLARSSFRKLLLQASKTLKQRQHTQASQAIFCSPTPINDPQNPSTQMPTSTTIPRRQIPTETTLSTTTSSNDATLLTAASDVTIALKRTHALLEQELEKSTISLESLNNSTQTLRQLENRYGAFDVLLRGSKKLIIELERADKWDRWMIYGGLAMFGLTCLWIVYRRLLRGPLGLLFWVVTKAVGAGTVVSRKGEARVVGSAERGEVKVGKLVDTGFQDSTTEVL